MEEGRGENRTGKERPCLVSSQNTKFFKIFSSHRIFGHMHEVLNINKK